VRSRLSGTTIDSAAASLPDVTSSWFDGADNPGAIDGMDNPGTMDGAGNSGARDGVDFGMSDRAGDFGTRDEVDDPDVVLEGSSAGSPAGPSPTVVVEVDATEVPELKRCQSDSARTTY
jgi:hypothetical protein